MKRIKLFISLIFAIFIFNTSNCQTFSINGIIKDSQSIETVPYAKILLTTIDSSEIKIISSDSLGYFETKIIFSPVLLVRVKSIGYKDSTFIFHLDTLKNQIDIGVLILTPLYEQLDEVTVTAIRKMIIKKVDRIVFNVSQTLSSAMATNAFELLGITPLVRTTPESISIIGKNNVSIMVNDRLFPLSQNDLIVFLQSIPANNVDKIEVITNPPAKYDASGNGGLINIVLKKNKLLGTNGNIYSSYSQAFYGTTELGGAINYRKNKINLFTSVRVEDGLKKNVENMHIENLNEQSTLSTTRKNFKQVYSGSIGLDYSPNDKSIFGLLYNGSTNVSPKTDNSIFENKIGNQLISVYNSKGEMNSETVNQSLNINYTHKNKKGNTLTANSDYLFYSVQSSRNFQSIFQDSNLISTNTINKQNGLQQQTNIGTVSLDWDATTKWMNYSIGMKSTYIQTLYNNSSYNIINNINYFDSTQSNRFSYNEKTTALYFSGTKQVKNIYVNVGLRAEYTNAIGYSKTLNSTNKFNYLQLFPTAYIMYEINNKESISFSYGRRINRPSYEALNPFRYYISPNNFTEGNPLLRPSYNHNFDLSYVYLNTYIFGATYSIQTEMMSQVPVFNNSDNTFAVVRRNIGNSQAYGVYAVIPFTVKKIWQSNLVLNYQRSVFYSNIDFLPDYKNQQQLYISLNNDFIFGKNNRYAFKILADMIPFPMQTDFIELNPSYVVNLAFRAKLLKEKALLSVGLNDLFFLSQPPMTSKFENTSIRTVNTYDTRNIKVYFSYSFGNNTLRAKRNRNLSNEDEKNRLKP